MALATPPETASREAFDSVVQKTYGRYPVTIVKGSRESDHTEREIATSVTRQERKTGDFTMTFRIPEEYNRRWDSATVDNGVLEIRYLPDKDEEET